MKKVTRRADAPLRRSTRKIIEAPIIQDLCPRGITDSLGRLVSMSVPCWGCCHAIRKGDVVRCRAGISQIADIRTLSETDPEAHGWADSPGVRPMDEKHHSMGHRGRYFLTLENVLVGGLNRPTFREVITRHVATVRLDNDNISSEEMARVAGNVRSEISEAEYLDDSVLDELECLVRRILGSEDVMDHPDRLVGHIGIEWFGMNYDPLDRPLDRPLRNLRREMDHWTPPVKHTRFHERFVHNPKLHDEIVRLHNGRLVSNGRVFTAAVFNRWGYVDRGWVRIRRFVKNLPVPDSHFIPNPDTGAITDKTRGFALIDRIICPIASSIPTAMVSVRAAACALMHVKDPECLQALWHCLTPELRERAMTSSKISEEAKRYAIN